MNISSLLLIAVTIGLDIAGQLGFKLGLTRLEETGADGSLAFWSGLMIQPWLLMGIAAYVVEFFLWLAVLSRVQLSIAFPLASLSYCGVLIASGVVLGEKISKQRWCGCGLITAGAAMVCVGIGS